MKWLTEHSIWVLLGLIIFMAAWFVAFFARNHQAKTDQRQSSGSDTKKADSIPLKKNDKSDKKQNDKF
jgi:hypothetical protein